MIIYVCCAGGATSSMFCKKIKDAEEDGDKIYFNEMHHVIKELQSGNLKEYNIVLGYGSADKVDNVFLEESNFKDLVDLIWVSPQARYHVNRIKAIVGPLGIRCEAIDMTTFGRMNGKKAISDLKEILHK